MVLHFPHLNPLSLSSFLKRYPEGTYILNYHGHALCAKDGAIIDNTANPGHMRVLVAWSKSE